MSHVLYVNESRHTWMSHGTSCVFTVGGGQPRRYSISYTWISRVLYMDGSRRPWICHGTSFVFTLGEGSPGGTPCLTYKWVLSCNKNNVYERDIAYMNELWHFFCLYFWEGELGRHFMFYIQMRRVSRMSESYPIWTNHATRRVTHHVGMRVRTISLLSRYVSAHVRCVSYFDLLSRDWFRRLFRVEFLLKTDCGYSKDMGVEIQ